MQRLIVLILLFAALALLVFEQRNVGRFQSEDGPLALSDSLIDAVPGGYAGRRLSRRVARIWGVDADLAREILLAQAVYYPLDADQWLNLARIEASRAGNESRRLSSHLNAAVAVNAGKRNTLWRSAQIAIQAEDYDLAERLLYQWLAGQPRNTGLVLITAGRWLPDPESLIERVLPDGPEFLVEGMQFASQQRNLGLADALWDRADATTSLDDPVLLDYVDLLVRSGRIEKATRVWARHDPYYTPGGVANGSFDRPIGESKGLNWQADRVPEGVRITRDETQYHSAPASLRIGFEAKNVRLRVPRLLIPVTSEGRYRLSGQWRGEALTTRSLPFLTLNAPGTRDRDRVEVPGPDFDWSPWSMTIEVPPESNRLDFRLQRNATEAFDRFIEGELWLDSIELTRLEDGVDQPLTDSAVNDSR